MTTVTNTTAAAAYAAAYAEHLFTTANGRVVDATGKIATVPNTQLPAPSTEGN